MAGALKTQESRGRDKSKHSKPESERDETPDVLGPGRGVGNLLSKLIDGNSSFPVHEE